MPVSISSNINVGISTDSATSDFIDNMSLLSSLPEATFFEPVRICYSFACSSARKARHQIKIDAILFQKASGCLFHSYFFYTGVRQFHFHQQLVHFVPQRLNLFISFSVRSSAISSTCFNKPAAFFFTKEYDYNKFLFDELS